MKNLAEMAHIVGEVGSEKWRYFGHVACQPQLHKRVSERRNREKGQLGRYPEAARRGWFGRRKYEMLPGITVETLPLHSLTGSLAASEHSILLAWSIFGLIAAGNELYADGA